MDFEVKKWLSLLRNKGALVNGLPTSETYDSTSDSLEASRDAIRVPTADAAANTNEADVIGNKTDTNAGNSIFAKQLIPTADVGTNISSRDVIGNKSDAAVTAVGAVASILAYIKGTLNQLATATALIDTTETTGPFSYLDAGAEQDVVEDATVVRRHIWLEVSNRNMTLSGLFKLYRKVDGASYDLWSTEQLLASGNRVLDYEFTTNQHWKITYTEDADEGAARSIPFNIITQIVE